MKILVKMMLFAGLLCSAEAYSWGTTGHRVIAEIAERHLTPKAKQKLKQILGNEKLAAVANWSDFIKSDTLNIYKETESWHYINVNSGLDKKEFEEAVKEMKGSNLYSKIQELKMVISNPKSNQKEQIFALKFLIHLLGDLHQPLHVGRAEDLGGNKITLSFFRENTNLHSLWDTKLVDFQKYSYVEFAEILDRKTKSEELAIQNGKLDDWLFESYQKASKIYTQTQPNTNYSYDYNYKFSSLLEEQLLSGGLRLAKVLNEILK